MAEKTAGYGQEDFSTGGFSQGRVKVGTFRIIAGPVGANGQKQKGVTAVLEGRDAAGGKQSLWMTLGGDTTETERKFKPVEGGKKLGLRTDKKPAKGCKYGLFLKSLTDIGFPMSRFAEMDLAALDGCTLDLDSKPMELSDAIQGNIKKEGKNPPTYFVATAFKLPGDGPAEVDGEEEAEASDPAAKLKAFVTKAVAKAGEPVAISVLKSTLASKLEADDDIDAMVGMLKLAWCAEQGFEVDKTAKTVGVATED